MAWLPGIRPVLAVVAISGFIALQYQGFGGRLLAPAMYAALGLWALLGPVQVIQALTLSWLGQHLNWAIPGYDFTFTILASSYKWIVLLAAMGRMGFDVLMKRTRVPLSVGYIVAFSLIVALISLPGEAPEISLLKLASFSIGTCSLMLAFHSCQEKLDVIDSWFMGLALVVVLGSLPLLFADYGYVYPLVGAPLFRGLLRHPNVLAISLALIAALLAGMLMSRHRRNLVLWCTLLATLFLLAQSGSRTGAAACVIGVVFTMAISIVIPRWRRELNRLVAHPALILAMAGVGLAGIMNFEALVTRLDSLTFKRGKSFTEEVSQSRGFLMEKQVDNFLRSPLVGIGFGVSSDAEKLSITRDELTGLPVGAPVEKGVIVTALLEETGLAGTLAFICLIGAILAPIYRNGAFFAGCLAHTALLLNLGEVQIFSMGGMGLLVWLVLGYVQLHSAMNATASRQRRTLTRTHSQVPLR